MATKKDTDKKDSKKATSKKEAVPTEVKDNSKETTQEVVKSEIPQAPLMEDITLPDLNKAEVVEIDLMSDYWTPEDKGESKRVFFKELKEREVLDSETGEYFSLLCAFFLEQQKDGSYKTIRNGSKKLVGVFEGGKIAPFTPLEITYLGKVKNTNNAFKSDMWSVKPLKV